MNISSLICEFDPLHSGHKLLLEHIRKSGADCIIACMSGNFTQRGEPAMFDKRTRTKAALLCGADIVIELPVSFACAGAERFAFGGVYILDALGCTDSIFFGSECGDISMLENACSAVCSDGAGALMRKKLSDGITFALARETAVRELFGNDTADILKSPNNILAVEYIKALKRLSSRIRPHTIKRTGAGHGGTAQGSYASASYLRELVLNGGDIRPFMPAESYSVFTEQRQSITASRMDTLGRTILYRLRTMTKEQLADLPDVGEGLENRLYEAVRRCTSTTELLAYVKTKRYAMSRLRRILMYALLGICKSALPYAPEYARILGFNDTGRTALTEIKKHSSIPIITKASEAVRLGGRCLSEFGLECRCDDIYALSGNDVLPCGTNQSGGLVIEKKS